jgi:hypothetical protein
MLAGRRSLATCCKPARQGKHVAGMLWVIWVIWVIVLNCKPAALGRHALGHLGHCFYVDPIDLKGADLARWWLWVFGSFGSFCHRIKIGGRSGVNVPLQSFYGLTLI